MAEDMLEKARDVFEAPIDFEGQRLAELLSTWLLVLIGAVSFLVGYTTQDIEKTLWTGLAGTGLVFAVVVPPWPFFNRHPVAWLPSNTGGVEVSVDGKKVG